MRHDLHNELKVAGLAISKDCMNDETGPRIFIREYDATWESESCFKLSDLEEVISAIRLVASEED